MWPLIKKALGSRWRREALHFCRNQEHWLWQDQDGRCEWHIPLMLVSSFAVITIMRHDLSGDADSQLHSYIFESKGNRCTWNAIISFFKHKLSMLWNSVAILGYYIYTYVCVLFYLYINTLILNMEYTKLVFVIYYNLMNDCFMIFKYKHVHFLDSIMYHCSWSYFRDH